MENNLVKLNQSNARRETADGVYAFPYSDLDRKIRVFISSKCGEPKYDNIRARLKEAIDKSNIAIAYTFESQGAATLSSGEHYEWNLEDSDVCIFLIDNADGITRGVQKEIDIVKKYNIKALYYFCDENKKEKTPLEEGLSGSKFAKYKTVHQFDDLWLNSANDLLNDIIYIYHCYCKGRIRNQQAEDIEENQEISISGSEKLPFQPIPKTVLKSIDKCKSYIQALVFNHPRIRDIDNTSAIDDWGFQFLSILFEGKSINSFNTALFLDALKAQQTPSHFQIVQNRWQAIQAYFQGDIEKCIAYLESALKPAKDTNQPVWIIKDILIDLRNEQWDLNCTKNRFPLSDAVQKELSDSPEELYYPILGSIQDFL